MQSKNYALGVCALIAATASASNKTYTVHKGDTVGTISQKFHISEKALISENSLGHKMLRVGKTLVIPSSPSKAAEYTIKAGDNDWTLAHRLGVPIAELRKLNPDADWHHLQIGDTLKVPGKADPDLPKFKARYAVVAKDEAIIRRGPSQDEDQVTQVDSGTKVTVLNYEHGWYQLKFPKGTVGWMRGDLLEASAPVKTVAVKVGAKSKVAKNAGKHAHVVAMSSAQSTSKFVSKPPMEVAMATSSATIDGKGMPPIKGLVEKSVVVSQKVATSATLPVLKKTRKTVVAMNYEPKATPTTAALLHKATSLKGTRYVWGGLSSRGLDCSGFTTTVFKSVGIHLPRTSRSQSTVGVAVPRGQLREGDLLFFATHHSTHINHVAMYIGQNKFIHASSGAGRVRVDSLAGYYSNRLVTARRVASVKASKVADEAPLDEAKRADSTVTAPKVDELIRPKSKITEYKGEASHSEIDP